MTTFFDIWLCAKWRLPQEYNFHGGKHYVPWDFEVASTNLVSSQAWKCAVKIEKCRWLERTGLIWDHHSWLLRQCLGWFFQLQISAKFEVSLTSLQRCVFEIPIQWTHRQLTFNGRPVWLILLCQWLKLV